MRVSNSHIQDVKSRYDLRQIYPQHLIARRSGEWWSAHCCFHHDPKPSAAVSAGGFRCFDSGCDAHGDVITFIQRSQNISFMEAVRWLVDGTDLRYLSELPPIPQAPPVNPPQFGESEVQSYMRALRVEDLDFLKEFKGQWGWPKIGLRPAIVDQFKIGTLRGALATGEPLEFSHLYTIPIHDPTGKLVNIRVYNPLGLYDKPKYFPTKEGAGSTLAFMDSLKEEKEVIIAAGEKDSLVGRQYGLPTTCGTAGEGKFDPGWVKYFERFEKIFVCYDNDEAGAVGTEKVCKVIPRAIPINLGFVENAPAGFDLTDFMNSGLGVDQFRKLMNYCETCYG